MTMIFFWVLFAIAVGIFASNRGRSGFGWFFLSLIISPLLGIIFCAVSKNLAIKAEIGPTPDTHVKCPDCRELILKDARKCKHCGTSLVPQ